MALSVELASSPGTGPIGHGVEHYTVKQAAIDHGGDLIAARALFAGAPEPFLDLSTGINPNPYPVPQLHTDVLARLPDSAALAKLANVAAAAYGAPAAAFVVPAPGTQLLLPLIAGLVGRGRAGVVAPTYAEHARAAALAGHTVTEVRDIGAVDDVSLAIITNPNNPDGRLFAKTDLLALARKLKPRGSLLVVDEAFMDVEPRDASLVSELALGNIVVLRSFGKFFGLAGVRLGFALAAPALADRISALLGPWAVSGPALTIGAAALADQDWIAETKARLAAATLRLDAILAGSGLDVVGGTTLFRLVRSSAASDLFQYLGRAGIFVRRFTDRLEWLRFGLPAAEQDWRRLQRAMASFGGKG
jgi:cobalamin biosynthetic protein CobC